MAMAASELLERGRALGEAGQAEEALPAALDALEGFRAQGDQAGVAEALRLALGLQVELLEAAPDAALKRVKEESAKLRRSREDGKVADALLNIAAAEVHLLKGDSEKALCAATDAAAALAKEGDARRESAAHQLVVGAQLARGNGPRALAAANAALSAAQKAGDRRAEASGWLSVAAARHAAGSPDAKEASFRALALYRELGDSTGEARALLLAAQADLAAADPQAATTGARAALATARAARSGRQAVAALETLVEALLALGLREEALSEAEQALAAARRAAEGLRRPPREVAATMAALLLAHTACRGIDSALALAKAYVVELRERGDVRGEALMLHRLATMSATEAEAMNCAQVALELAERIGDGSLEAAIKSTLTDLYVARGKVEKAPTRKPALKALADLAQALESQDGDRFDDAARLLDGLYAALRPDDIEAALGRVIAADPEAYTQFLKEHGHAIAEERQATTGCTARPVPHEVLYFGFAASGLNYGPRYRVNVPAYKRYNSETISMSVVELQDASETWERQLRYNPSMMDGVLQHAAAAAYPSL